MMKTKVTKEQYIAPKDVLLNISVVNTLCDGSPYEGNIEGMVVEDYNWEE